MAIVKRTARKRTLSFWGRDGHQIRLAFPYRKPSKLEYMTHKFKRNDKNLIAAFKDNLDLNQPKGAARLMRRSGASFDQNHKLTGRAIGDLNPESPASYNSSVEVSSLNQAITPSSSLDLKGRLRGSGHNIKTSTELVKVLNRIWSLEEQLASNVSLVKTLKVELHHAHSRIQELTQEQQSYRHEMDDLMKRVSEDRLSRKHKEQERIKEAVQSMKTEVEDEKKLRQWSEGLHRKLAKELSEADSAFKMTLNDLQSERNARYLLEDLCDEFAKGLQEYDREIQNLKQKFGKDGNHSLDHSLHHISKVWMEGRLQMKIAEAQGDEAEKKSILKGLSAKITSFVQARRLNGSARRKGEKESSLRRRSLESVHLNAAVGAPQDAEDDDSVVSDLHCFELNMDVKDNVSQSSLKQNDEEGMERLKGKNRATFRNGKLKYPEDHDIHSLKQERNELCNGSKMHHIHSSRGNSSHNAIERCKVNPENDHTGSCNQFSVSSQITQTGEANASGSGGPHNQHTLLSQWNFHHTPSDQDISRSSSKLPPTVKENSLKEKLLEARLEGRNARLRALKDSSFGGIQ
ncbi:uncharacterized protein A4U43_C05F28500 [Asparagus officinalis]|uniref:Uncharacterized protein n=1 Tax=Asparagus officinalis TaxID=4686 RepID=A0A5P1EV47_ASPOF|nr:uncharacterized protein A4U43_C05F28500 [Asparagus officinalis]